MGSRLWSRYRSDLEKLSCRQGEGGTDQEDDCQLKMLQGVQLLLSLWRGMLGDLQVEMMDKRILTSLSSSKAQN